jgi:hypothetical protein
MVSPAALAAGALTVNALLWGVSWWPFRMLHAQGVHGLWATALVYLAVAAVIVAWDRARPHASPPPARCGRCWSRAACRTPASTGRSRSAT